MCKVWINNICVLLILKYCLLDHLWYRMKSTHYVSWIFLWIALFDALSAFLNTCPLSLMKNWRFFNTILHYSYLCWHRNLENLMMPEFLQRTFLNILITGFMPQFQVPCLRPCSKSTESNFEVCESTNKYNLKVYTVKQEWWLLIRPTCVLCM